MLFAQYFGAALTLALIAGSARLMWLRKTGFDRIGSAFFWAALGVFAACQLADMLYAFGGSAQFGADLQASSSANLAQMQAAEHFAVTLPLDQRASVEHAIDYFTGTSLQRVGRLIPVWVHVCLGLIVLAEGFLYAFWRQLTGEPGNPSGGAAEEERHDDQ